MAKRFLALGAGVFPVLNQEGEMIMFGRLVRTASSVALAIAASNSAIECVSVCGSSSWIVSLAFHMAANGGVQQARPVTIGVIVAFVGRAPLERMLSGYNGICLYIDSTCVPS